MAKAPEDDLELIRRFCADRVPEDQRDQTRIEADERGRSVTIVERRAPWHPDDDEWTATQVAQLRHDPASGRWSLFWSDRNGRWHLYDETVPGSAADLLEVVAADPTGVFWG